jgi:hypothetical protein
MHTVNVNGNSIQFPSLKLATMYAKSVKGAKVVEGGTDEDTTIEVVKCPEGADAVRAREEYVGNMLGSKALGEVIARKLTTPLRGKARGEKTPAQELSDVLLSRLGIGNVCKHCGSVSKRKCGRGNVCFMCKKFPTRQAKSDNAINAMLLPN